MTRLHNSLTVIDGLVISKWSRDAFGGQTGEGSLADGWLRRSI